jgi:ketosteroid isomerase-like protein
MRRSTSGSEAPRGCNDVATPVRHPPDVDGIEETRAAFVAALAGGDARAASAAYTGDARLLPPAAGVLRGRSAIQAFWQAGLDAGMLGAELETIEVGERSELAFEIGRYSLRLRPAEGGGEVVDRGTYVHVHERQPDGSWQRAVEMFSPVASPSRDASRQRGNE